MAGCVAVPPPRARRSAAEPIADPARAAARELARLGVAPGDADVEMLRPIALGVARRLVPIVLDLLVNQHRPLAGDEAQERARRLRQRHPGLEIRLDAERIGLVVAEHGPLVAGEDHRAVEAGRPQRVVEPLVEDGEVGAVLAREPPFELFARRKRESAFVGLMVRVLLNCARGRPVGGRAGIIDGRPVPPKAGGAGQVLDPRRPATETAASPQVPRSAP